MTWWNFLKARRYWKTNRCSTSSIQVVLGLVASLVLELKQLDVKTVFLHGDLKEEIYIDQLEGFKVKGKEHMICKLKKSMYSLKQASRQWYKKFDSFMVGHGYTRTNADHCVYVRKFPNGKFVILLLYVDDMLIVGQDAGVIGNLKKDLFKSFDLKDLGLARQILGMQILHDRKAKNYGYHKRNILSGFLKGSIWSMPG